MSKKIISEIGIVGATGIVGSTLIDILIKNDYKNLKLCASDVNVNKDFVINNQHFKLQQLNEDFFNNLYVVFFCTDNDISGKWIPYVKNLSIFVIDNSSAFRMDADVPLIVPEINKDLIDCSNGIIANPNCCAVLLCMTLYPLLKLSKIKALDISTYQAVSGAGIIGMKELELQTKQIAKGEECEKLKFKSQIYGNCFSHNSNVDINSGYNDEEIKISNEIQKILNAEIKISATCVRVPVFRSHSIDVRIEFVDPVKESDIVDVLKNFNGLKIIDDRILNKFPEPLDASNQTDVLVGRIRKGMNDETNTIYKLFICGDQILKGASYNAFQIFKEYGNKIVEQNN